MRYLTAGESHGEALISIIDGVPSGLMIDIKKLNAFLLRRKEALGRSERSTAEKDEAVILSGINDGVKTGAPIALIIKNAAQAVNDNEFKTDLSGYNIRPAHADYAGCIKYKTDVGNVSERASARETAARAAAGFVAISFLAELGVGILSHTLEIGGIRADAGYKDLKDLKAKKEKNGLNCYDKKACDRMKERIDGAKAGGDSVGGIVQVIAAGVPAGIGSHTQWDLKLDANLAKAVMSVQGVKGVEFGLGFEYAAAQGSSAHDRMRYEDGKLIRASNNSGGIDGGMSNGENIIFNAAIKPVPTLAKGLPSVNIDTKENIISPVVRADTCAVAAAGVVLEAVTALELAAWILKKTGGDNMEEIKNRMKN
jgi:chorismate synthase